MANQSVAISGVENNAYRWKDHLKVHSLAWWIWAAFAVLLVLALSGIEALRYCVLFLSGLMAAFYVVRHRSLRHFPTQVRVVYFLWMSASFVPPLTPMFWIQTAGTVALTGFGYCPLARTLLLFPFNRKLPLSPQRALRIFFHPPTAGSVRDDLAV